MGREGKGREGKGWDGMVRVKIRKVLWNGREWGMEEKNTSTPTPDLHAIICLRFPNIPFLIPVL